MEILLRLRPEFNFQQLKFFLLFPNSPEFYRSKQGFTKLMLKLHVVSLKYHVFSFNIHEICEVCISEKFND